MTGKILPCTIFSIISGTAITMVGFTSAKAFSNTDGLGALVKKCTWVPMQNSYMNSKAKPYMCAIGKRLTSRVQCSKPNFSSAN